MAVNQIKHWGFPATTHHAVLILTLIFPAISAVNGQSGGIPSDSTDPYSYARFSPSMAIIIAVLVTALFFMGFFSIYIRRWSQSGSGGTAILSMRSRRAAAARGLDASVIETFPTLAYSEVKDLHMGKGALECAVCLNEFEDDETLRLLPKCDHVFHPECIDLWLASHTTCPVCRADLVPVPGESVEQTDELPVSQPGNEGDNVVDDNVQVQGEVHVTIPDENQELATNISVEPSKPEVINRTGSLRLNRPPRSGSVRSGSVRSKLLNFGNKFPRSHSTGHSIVQPGENVDRYTLRLPDEVRKDIIKKALNRTGSCVSGEGSVKKGTRTGNEEGSSRGKRSYKRLESLERIEKSDRWSFVKMPSFLTRALSTRSPKVVAGEGETSTSVEPAKGNGNDTTGKDEKPGREGNNPAKLPV